VLTSLERSRGKVNYGKSGRSLALTCIHSLLNKIVGYYNEGAIQPIRPTTCYEASQYEEAFRSMQKGQNFGKLVLQIPEDPALPAAVPARLRTTFRSDATYLLVGGLGGLGRSVAIWMAEHGARNLAFLSRSASTTCSETAAFIDELSALSCDAQVIAGDVTRLEDVYRVRRESLLPVAGVIQMSMVLQDGLFAQSTHEDWQAVAAPKVEGTWNLHKAFSKDDLDFFVMFSSISGTVGNPGQASYASANTFLDAFMHFRHNEGMAASVLDIGAMGDVGFVSQNQSVMDHLSAKFGYVLQEQDLLDGLELAIKHSRIFPQMEPSTWKSCANRSQIGLGFKMSLPSTAPENKAVWRNDTRMSIYRNQDATASAGVDDQSSRRSGGDDLLKVLLATASNDPAFLEAQTSIDIMATYIGATLFDFMMRPLEDLDVKMSPKSLGMDSLVAIELKNWFKQRVGVEVGVLEIMGAGSMEQLGAGVLERIAVRLAGKGDQ
jgi:NADP-dependent 3-hydroxy acid dehydrogenase YdfG